MSKIFTYYKAASPDVYSEQMDDYVGEEEPCYFEVDNDKLSEALADLVFFDYFNNFIENDKKEDFKKTLTKFIRYNELTSVLGEVYEDDLKDLFEKEAFEGEKDYEYL